MEPSRSSPAVLLHHDGELADIRALLDDLGLSYVERLGATEKVEPTHAWDVVIGSPRRILHFRPSESATGVTLIAIMDGDSRTLRAHLRRVRVHLMVRRPVHPAALRLLILHAVYRGPERRRLRRVSVGADVRLRSGLMSRGATMTDFSVRGCRLLARRAVLRGKRVILQIPARVTGDRPLRVKATVVRSEIASDNDPGLFVMGLRFDEPSDALRSRLEDVLDAHTSGPAMLDPQPARESDGADPPPSPQATPTCATQPAAPTDAAEPDAAPRPKPPRAPGDRREDCRHTYEQRIVALGEQATRVLLGRDISLGGMRIVANSAVAIGDRLRLALHNGDRADPLVLDAAVHRDDGDRGLVLRFETPEPETRTVLEEMLENLPMIAGGVDDAADDGLMISEIIEHRVAG